MRSGPRRSAELESQAAEIGVGPASLGEIVQVVVGVQDASGEGVGRAVGDGFDQGYSNPQIAARLFVSRATVETHLKRVYAKLSIDGRHQLHLLHPATRRPDAP